MPRIVIQKHHSYGAFSDYSNSIKLSWGLAVHIRVYPLVLWVSKGRNLHRRAVMYYCAAAMRHTSGYFRIAFYLYAFYTLYSSDRGDTDEGALKKFIHHLRQIEMPSVDLTRPHRQLPRITRWLTYLGLPCIFIESASFFRAIWRALSTYTFGELVMVQFYNP